jgi:putative peptidoglycan lipid II flippase
MVRLTVNLLRIMLPSAAIFGISGLVMAILNANQIFFIPAITPAMYQIGMIFGVVVLSPRLGIYGLAWGVLLGSALHLGLQIPVLLRQRGVYTIGLGLDNPDVREVGRLMGPRLVGVAVVQLNFWVNIYLATGQAEGSATAIVTAFSLMLMPQAAIAQSIAVAAMPTFSAQVARGEISEMRSSLAASLRGVLFLSIPASLGLMILRVPIIELLLRGGEFGARSTELVSWALLWYAVGLVGHSVVEIVARAFYSLHDTRTPVIVGAAAMSLNIIFSLVFSAGFERMNWMPHGGLALANSVATALEMLALLYLMRKRLGGLGGLRIPIGGLQALGAASLMSFAILGWMNVVSGRPSWVIGVGGIALGGLVYVVCILLLGVSEANLLIRAARRRLGL